jgi:hypothetical protein
MTDDRERMRDAVWSVYFKARGLRRSVLPPAARPVRLERALDTLLTHQDRHRGARRGRAVLQLAAAGLHRRARDPVAGRVRALAGALQVAEAVLDGVATRTPAAADDLLRQLTAAGRDCVGVTTEDVKIEYDPRTFDSSFRSSVLVHRRIEDVPPLIDPRNWKVCSDYFERSDPVDPRTLEPVTVVDPARRWQLYEVFSVPGAAYDNLLNIEFSVTPRRIEMTYSLYASLKWTFLGREYPGVLERDSGFVHAEPDGPDRTRLMMTKTVRFRDLTPDDPVVGGIDPGQWLNYTAPAALALWLDDMSQARQCCTHALGG